MEAREYIMDKMDEVLEKQQRTHMFPVVLFWRGPFNDFNKKVVFFEDYTDCIIYAEELKTKYTEYDMPFLLYINCCVRGWNKETELTKLVIPESYKEVWG